MRKTLAILALPLLAACSTSHTAQSQNDAVAISQLKAPAVMTIQGTVQSTTLVGNKHFTLQDNSGKVSVVVVAAQKPPVHIHKGDNVVVDGYLNANGSFEATHVAVLNHTTTTKVVKKTKHVKAGGSKVTTTVKKETTTTK
jgi:cytochrome c-type biogenesis protein CcmE